MNHEVEVKELRNFGLMVGGIFLVIGLWPMVWRGEGIRLWAIGLGGLLIPLGLLMPAVLAPVFKVWMKVGHVLGGDVVAVDQPGLDAAREGAAGEQEQEHGT